MSKKKWLLAVAGVLLLGAIFTVAFSSRREPVHKGRPISEWLKDYTSNDFQKYEAADAALREMGSAAIPYLTNSFAQRNALLLRLYRKDVIPKKVVDGLGDRIEWQAPVMESRNAARALSLLGSSASNAVPDLVAALEDPSTLIIQAASEALGRIGPPAVSLLHERLRQAKTNTPLSIWIIRSLAQVGPAALPAAPEVISFITNAPPDGDYAVDALVNMGAETLPLVTNYFNDPNPLMRRRVMMYLFQSGPKALPAMNLIKQAQHDPDPTVRLLAIYSVHTVRSPIEISRPLNGAALSDTHTNNLLAAVQLLSLDNEGVLQNNRRLAELSQHSDSRVGLAASNVLNSFDAWPKK